MKNIMILLGVILFSASLAHADHGVGNGGDPRELFLLNASQSLADSVKAQNIAPDEFREKFLEEAAHVNMRVLNTISVCVALNPIEHTVRMSADCFNVLKDQNERLLLTLANAIAALAGVESLDTDRFGSFSKASVTSETIRAYSSRIQFVSSDCLYRFDSRLKMNSEIKALVINALEQRQYHFSEAANLVIGDEGGHIALLAYQTTTKTLTQIASALLGFSFLENVTTDVRRVKETDTDSFLVELLSLPVCRIR